MSEEPKPLRRKRRWPWLALLTLIGFVAFAFVLVPRPKLLLARAHRVMSMEHLTPYFLLSERKVIEVLPVPHQKINYYVSQVDFATGKALMTTPEAQFAQTMSGMPMTVIYLNYNGTQTVKHEYIPPPCVLSPDSKYLLYLSSPQGGYVASTLDGKHQVKWLLETSLMLDPVWLIDDRRWVESILNQNGYAGAMIYNLNNPKSREKIFFATPMSGRLEWPIATGEVLAQDYDPSKPTDHVDFQAVRLDGKVSPAPVRKFTTTLLPGCLIYNFSVSPQGDRIAWACKMPVLPPGPAPVRKFLSLFGSRTHSYVGIWISKVDGSDLREVGHLPEQKQTDNDTESVLITDLRWTPNGKRLGFVYDGSLWTVPVE